MTKNAELMLLKPMRAKWLIMHHLFCFMGWVKKRHVTIAYSSISTKLVLCGNVCVNRRYSQQWRIKYRMFLLQKHVMFETVIIWLLIWNRHARIFFTGISCLSEWYVMVSIDSNGDGDDGWCLGWIFKSQHHITKT